MFKRAVLRGGPFGVRRFFFVIFITAFCLKTEASPPPPKRFFVIQLVEADRFQRKDEPQKGINICDAVISQAPNTVQAYVIKARCFVDLGKMAEARTLLGQALRIDPQSAEVHLELGQWHCAKKRIQRGHF